MTNELTGMAPVSITRRRVVAGAAGLGAASLLGLRMAHAQDTTATPGAGTTVTDETTDATDATDLRAESYQDFVDKLAANLGMTDTASVDTAIRDSLKAMIDDRLAAGEISANSATEWTAEIDSSVAPLRVGFFGDGGPRGGHGPGGDRGNGMKPGRAPGMDDDSNDSTTPTDTTGTPEATGANGLVIS
jgi:hypothetical protein